MKKVNLIIGAVILMIVIGAVAFFVLREPKIPGDDGVTLAAAAKMGEMQTRKLLIQIRNSNQEGDPERGDVVLVAPADKEFSPAEIGGFLIVKMKLTDKQVEIITKPKQKLTGEKDDTGNPVVAQEKARKYSIDLGRIGVAADDFAGREIADKLFEWQVIKEKKESGF